MRATGPSFARPSRYDLGGMMESLDKLRDLSSRDLQTCLQMPKAHEHLLSEDPASAALLIRLVELELLPEAARLLGYALPEREAGWWACRCVAHAVPLAALPAEQGAAHAAAEAWVRRPDDEARLRAHLASAKAGYRTPAARAAQAAFASPLPVSWPMRTGRKVERAVALAAAYDGPAHRPERLRRFIASGRDIAGGGAGRVPPAAGAILGVAK